MKRTKVSTRLEYNNLLSEGVEPLLDPFIDMDIKLRVEIQSELFGSNSDPKARDKFFHWVWEHKPQLCEEHNLPLEFYKAEFMSHILSRGAHIEMALDPRNINILCSRAHRKWETGDRRSMKIYNRNMEVIEILKSDYSQLKPYNKF